MPVCRFSNLIGGCAYVSRSRTTKSRMRRITAPSRTI